MLFEHRAVVSATRLRPRARGINYLQQRHRAFAIRAQCNTPRFLRAAQQVAAITLRQHVGAIGQQERGSVCSSHIRVGGPLLRRQFKLRDSAFGVGALYFTAIAVKYWQWH